MFRLYARAEDDDEEAASSPTADDDNAVVFALPPVVELAAGPGTVELEPSTLGFSSNSGAA